MAEPPIKRYALVPKAGEDGVRRFQLARVSRDGRSPERMERMEEIAGLDGHHGEAPDDKAPPGDQASPM
jgi:hypothetical protein